MKKNSGFTFLELSVVMLVIGILILGSTTGSITILKNARIRATQKRLDLVELALTNYLIENKRLPCPAGLRIIDSEATVGQEISDCHLVIINGSDDKTGVYINNTDFSDEYSSNIVFGAVPAVTLGLPKENMKDAWDQKFGYAVDKRLTQTSVEDIGINTNFRSTTPTIRITTDTTGTDLTTEAAYMLISYGEDMEGSFSYYVNEQIDYPTASATSQEQENILDVDVLLNLIDDETGDKETPFVNSFVNYVYDENFDDLIRYKTRIQLARETKWEDIGCIYSLCGPGADVFVDYSLFDNSAPYSDTSCEPDCTITCYEYGRSVRTTGTCE